MALAPNRRTIFISGAAAGIGRATALRFADAGWFIGLSDVNAQGLADLQTQIGVKNCTVGVLDVTQADQWSQLLAEFWSATGRLDVLFNNAGVAVTAPFEASPLARHHQLVAININGVINGCYAAHPYLRQTANSRVINMSSASTIYGQPMLATYSASKAAIRTLTEALDIEWRPQGIRVADLLPLFVNTAMVVEEVSRMKTVQTLGVKLSAEDIAAEVWRLAQLPPRAMPVHTYVGLQTRLLAPLARISPDFMNRWITARLADY